ncbi:unnamed protein product, partial [Angiostrongylus costaricensis]|uniref:Phosphatidate cytidylyltransferase n=1 Tax=Angiostrongylus costaricensis TaxID=334426 RepID=A0A0R3PXA9_ANGCS
MTWELLNTAFPVSRPSSELVVKLKLYSVSYHFSLFLVWAIQTFKHLGRFNIELPFFFNNKKDTTNFEDPSSSCIRFVFLHPYSRRSSDFCLWILSLLEDFVFLNLRASCISESNSDRPPSERSVAERIENTLHTHYYTIAYTLVIVAYLAGFAEYVYFRLVSILIPERITYHPICHEKEGRRVGKDGFHYGVSIGAFIAIALFQLIVSFKSTFPRYIDGFNASFISLQLSSVKTSEYWFLALIQKASRSFRAGVLDSCARILTFTSKSSP